MHKVLLVSLSAALISVKLTGIAEAAYTQRDVNRMEDLISAGNWVDLRIFLLANPRILNGSDPFTLQLQNFLEETDSLYTALTFDASLFPNLNAASPTEPARRVVRAPRPQSTSPSDTPSASRSDTSDSNGARNGSGAGARGSAAAVSIY